MFGRARCQQAGHPTIYTGEADEMSYRGNGDPEAPDAVEDSAKRGDPVRSSDCSTCRVSIGCLLGAFEKIQFRGPMNRITPCFKTQCLL